MRNLQSQSHEVHQPPRRGSRPCSGQALGDRAGTVGIGRYFGDDIFVSLAQDFGGPKGGTQRQLQGLIGTSVTIQYSLTPSLTLQTASSTEGNQES